MVTQIYCVCMVALLCMVSYRSPAVLAIQGPFVLLLWISTPALHPGSEEVCLHSNTLPVPQAEERGERGGEGSCPPFSMHGLEFV